MTIDSWADFYTAIYRDWATWLLWSGVFAVLAGMLSQIVYMTMQFMSDPDPPRIPSDRMIVAGSCFFAGGMLLMSVLMSSMCSSLARSSAQRTVDRIRWEQEREAGLHP